MKYVASCSFGKDSIATILLALEHNEPLDGAVFCEVMYDHKSGLSGEIPEHIDWIYKTAIPKLAALGVQTTVIRAEKDYLQCFYGVVSKGQYTGKLHGFPLGGKCMINRDCKLKAIREYFKSLGDEVTTYIGIASDEPERLARLKSRRVSLLAKYGYTEAMAYDLCRKYGLLSPIYQKGRRGGCWFCPSARIEDLARLRKQHPELWELLEALSYTPNLSSYGFKYGKTIQEIKIKLDQFDKKQKDMNVIRVTQLSLFEDPAPDTLGG